MPKYVRFIMKKPSIYIDIFAGCGGLSAGLLNAGWTGLFAVEKNANAFYTLKYNLIDKEKHFYGPHGFPYLPMTLMNY